MTVKSPHVEIYPERDWDLTPDGDIERMFYRWRWLFRSSNGKILSRSSEAYNDPRDLVRGLELSFPSYLLRDAGRSLEGVGGWYLWPGAYTMAPIPVRVPEGTVKLWRARRKR